MSSRPLIIASLVGASVGVPYVMSHWPGAKDGAAASQSASSGIWQTTLPGGGALPSGTTRGATMPLVGAPTLPLELVLRFDLTKDWVYRQWARKSTGLADAELFGVRVPLVTGTAVGDLAGSLTYYFNAQDELQHISFRGQTGDTSRLVSFLMQYYEFERESAPAGEELYQVTSFGKVKSELRTRPANVLWTSAPHGSYAVDLELERPGSRRYMQPRGPNLEIPPDVGVE